MTCDDLLQGDSFPEGTKLAFAEPGSPNNPEPISFHPTQDPISSTDGSIHALGCGSKGGTATGAVAIGFQDDTTPKTSEERIGALRADAGGEGACVAFQSSQSGVRVDDVHATLDSNNGSRRHNGALAGMSVRRLTPTECERLQGFQDDYTNIPWRGRTESPDGPRYKALGNSMAVPVMAWIGRRIQMVNAAIESEPLNFD